MNELKQLLEFAGVDTTKGKAKLLVEMDDHDQEDADAAAEEAMMQELHGIKAQLDDIMKRYPHANYLDVTNWLAG